MKKIQAALARALGLRVSAQDQNQDQSRSCLGIPSRPNWTWPQYHDL